MISLLERYKNLSLKLLQAFNDELVVISLLSFFSIYFSILSIILFICIKIFVRKYQYLLAVITTPVWIVSILLVFPLAILSAKQLYSLIKLQMVRNKHSWLSYVFGGLICTPVGFAIVNTLFFIVLNNYCHSQTEIECYFLILIFFPSWELVMGSLLLTVLMIENWYIFQICFGGDYTEREISHAPGAAGILSDELDFKVVAEHYAASIMSLSNFVNVVLVDGKLGEGKSSFVRMIIEYIESKKRLYTYISLTEANRAKDFSSLFAERWFETISARYPKLNFFSELNLISEIMKESGNGIVGTMLKFLTRYNIPLLKTESKTNDAYTCSQKYVSANVAKLFANIDRIDEDVWIIVIDELDRSLLEEIYRVNEVIERFKYEGRTGLPIKLVFILCASTSELHRLLSDSDVKHNSPELSFHIANFLLDKQPTFRISVPVVDSSFKRDYIIGLINKTITEANGMFMANKPRIVIPTLDPVEIEELVMVGVSKPSQKATFSILIKVLIDEVPRIANRVQEQSIAYLRSFKTKKSTYRNTVWFSEVEIMSYLHIKFPKVYFELEEITKKYLNDAVFSYEIEPPERGSRRSTLELIEENYKNSTGRDLLLTASEKKNISSLLGIVAKDLNDSLSGNPRTNLDPNYDDWSLGQSKNRIAYYKSLEKSETESDQIGRDIYLKISKGKNIETLIKSFETLHEYSKFIRERGPYVKDSSHFDIAKLIYNDMNKKKIKLRPRDISFDTEILSLTAEFSLQLLECMEKGKKSVMSNCVNLIRSYLESTQIPFSSRLRVVSNFLDFTDLDGSTLRFKYIFDELRKLGLDTGLLNAAKRVFSECKKAYFTGSKDIYENEENYFYVMYQCWDGKAYGSELQQIHSCFSRELQKYPDVINIFWEMLPSAESFDSYKDLQADIVRAHFHDQKIEFYIPLGSLVQATESAFKNRVMSEEKLKTKMKWWKEKVLFNSQVYEQFKKDRSYTSDVNETLLCKLRNQYSTYAI